MSIHQKNLLTAALFAVTGALLSWDAFRYSYNSSFFLRGLALTLLILGISYGLLLLTRRPVTDIAAAEAPDGSEGSGAGVILTLKVFILLAGYVLLLSAFGFLFATIAFALAGQSAFSGGVRRRHLVYAVCLAFFIFYLFFEALGVRLPDAPWSLDPLFRIP